MTSTDHTNLIISMFAKSRKVDKVIAKIAAPSFVKLSENAGVDSNITPQYIITSKVLQYVRGQANKSDKGATSSLVALHKMADNRVEALEFDVAEEFEHTGIPLSKLKLKPNVLVAAVIRNGNVHYAHGDTTIEVGDRVIVLTINPHVCDLDDVLA